MFFLDGLEMLPLHVKSNTIYNQLNMLGEIDIFSFYHTHATQQWARIPI